MAETEPYSIEEDDLDTYVLSVECTVNRMESLKLKKATTKFFESQGINTVVSVTPHPTHSKKLTTEKVNTKFERPQSAEIESLRTQLKIHYADMRASSVILKRAESLISALKKRHEQHKLAYSQCDTKLSLLDGRFERVQAASAVTPSKAHHKVVTVKDPTDAYMEKFANASAEEQQRMLAELKARG